MVHFVSSTTCLVCFLISTTCVVCFLISTTCVVCFLISTTCVVGFLISTTCVVCFLISTTCMVCFLISTTCVVCFLISTTCMVCFLISTTCVVCFLISTTCMVCFLISTTCVANCPRTRLFLLLSSLVFTRIIVCAVACAIAITNRPTTGQSLYMTALTGNSCRFSSERFEYDVTTGIHSTYIHRFHRRREPVAFVISTSQFVLLLLIIRGGDVSKNPGPGDVRRQYTHRHSCTRCGKGVTGRSRALSCDNCDQWTHLLCARSMTSTLYQELCNSGENFDFLCNRCSIGNLPFADVDDILSLTHTSDVSLSASISEEEDIFHDLRLVRSRCRNNVIISHLNINSLRHKFHDLTDLFSDRLVDIIFISETKLDSTFTQAQFDAPGYTFSFRKYRNCHGGGILPYIISDLPARRRPGLELSRIESVIIEITFHNRKWGIVCAYRPPPSMNNSIFIDDFTAGVDRLHVYFDNVIVAGDLNYDFQIPHKCQPLQSVCDIFDFTNLINKPTCFTNNFLPSVVDVILTNIPSYHQHIVWHQRLA